MAPRRVRRRRRTKHLYGTAPIQRASAVYPVSKSAVVRLPHNFYARMPSVVNAWSPIFLHFGAPMNVIYRGSNHSNNCDAAYPLLAQQHAQWYIDARYMWRQFVQISMKVKVTFFFDTFPTTLSLIVGVGGDGVFAGNTGDSFPFDNLYEATNAPYTKQKLLRGINQSASQASEAVVSKHFTARQLHGASWSTQDYAQPTIATGINLNTPSQISNAGMNSFAFGCICLFAALPFQYTVPAVQYPQLFVELEHELLFFDPKISYN